jgi:hypothetical protein
MTFLKARLHREKKEYVKKYKIPNQNSLGSVQGELSQRKERLRKTSFCVFMLTDL